MGKLPEIPHLCARYPSIFSRSDIPERAERPIISPTPPFHPRSFEPALYNIARSSLRGVELVKRSNVAGIGRAVFEEIRDPFLKLPESLKLELVTHDAEYMSPIILCSP